MKKLSPHLINVFIIVLILIVSTILATFYPLVDRSKNGEDNPDLQNYEFDLKNWDLTDGSGLALSYVKNQDRLAFVEILVGRVSSTIDSRAGWQITSEGIFSRATFSLTIIPQINKAYTDAEIKPSADIFDESWALVLNDCSSADCQTQIHNIHDQLTKLQNGFTTDILKFGLIENITDHSLDVISDLKALKDVLWWKISHMYSDTMFVQMEVFQQNLIIRIREIISITQSGYTFGLIFNTDSSRRRTYSTQINGSFDGYTSAINSLIDTFDKYLNV